MKIEDLKAIQILDSRGNPTIKVSACVSGVWADFSVPSGASTGAHEALELRDGGSEYNGLGVEKAIRNVLGPIKEKIVGLEAENQKVLDEIMIALDGTPNKGKLGANAILGVSGAVTRATAEAHNVPLYQYLRSVFENGGMYEAENYPADSYVMPRLFMNIINGGAHADNNIDIQETMIVPRAKTVSGSVEISEGIYHSLKNVIAKRGLSTGLGDEGGFAPDLESNEEAMALIAESVKNANFKLGDDAELALDIAASELYNEDGTYRLGKNNISADELIEYYKKLIAEYPIISIEDGMAEDDWANWQKITSELGEKIQLVGDDLFVTNPKRIAEGIEKKAANAVLIKINQIGTITETMEAIKLAHDNEYHCMISHRSGETDDSYIADLVVATGVGQIKAGAPARGERTAKYNRLIEIEAELLK